MDQHKNPTISAKVSLSTLLSGLVFKPRRQQHQNGPLCTLSIGLCLALLVRMGLGHRLDFLAPSALENRKILGFEDCFSAINNLKNCGAALSHAVLAKHPLPKAYLRGGVLEPEELLFGRTVDTDAVLGEVLGFLYKTKSVSAAYCHSLNEISDKCWALGLVLKNRLTFQLVSTFCKAYDD